MIKFPDRGPNGGIEWSTYVVLIGGFLALIAFEFVQNFEPRKLSALFFLASWMILVAVHELGHAIMAWLCGWRVDKLVIGFGPTILNRHWFGVDMHLRLLPIEGFVSTVPRRLHAASKKHALIYSAGPGIELLLAYLLCSVVGYSRFFSYTNDYSLLVLQSFALAAVTGAVVNLIPHATIADGLEIPNDGLGIIRALRTPDEAYRVNLN